MRCALVFSLLCCIFSEVMELETKCALCYLAEWHFCVPGLRSGPKPVHWASLITHCRKQLLFSEAGFFCVCVQKHFPFSLWHAHGNIKSGCWFGAPPARSQNAVSNQRVEKSWSSMTLKSNHKLLNIVVHYLSRQTFLYLEKQNETPEKQMQIFFYTRIPLKLNHFVVLKLTLSESKSRSYEID